MGQIGYRCGAGQLRPILGEGRWFRASIVEEHAFLAEVRPTISDYLRSPVPLAPVVQPTSAQLTTSLPQVEQQQKDGLSTPTKRPPPPSVQPKDAVFVPVPDWIGDGQTQYHCRHPPHQLHRLRYPHQSQPSHPPVFAQDAGKWQERWRSRCYNTRL